MKNRQKFSIIVLCFVVIGVLFTINTYVQTHHNEIESERSIAPSIEVKSSPEKSQKVISATCINLYDGYAGDELLSRLYGEDDIFMRLQSFNQKLNEYENYYEVSFQPLQTFEYFNMNEDFVKIYNSKGGKIENQLVNFEGENVFVTSLNTIQINKNFNDIFLAAMGNGMIFEEKDFVLYELDQIPVILGNNYRKYYNAEDTIQLNYLGTNYSFRIKGFLAPNAKLRENDEIFYLDNYICMPNFQFYSAVPVLEDSENFVFLMRYYLQNNWGYFQYDTPDDAKAIAKEIGKLAEQYGLDYSFIYNSFTFECDDNSAPD